MRTVDNRAITLMCATRVGRTNTRQLFGAYLVRCDTNFWPGLTCAFSLSLSSICSPARLLRQEHTARGTRPAEKRHLAVKKRRATGNSWHDLPRTPHSARWFANRDKSSILDEAVTRAHSSERSETARRFLYGCFLFLYESRVSPFRARDDKSQVTVLRGRTSERDRREVSRAMLPTSLSTRVI